MKVFILVLNQDITNTPTDIDQFVKVSLNREELENLMETGNSEIDEVWDEDWMEYDGISMSSKPYYYIMEKEV